MKRLLVGCFLFLFHFNANSQQEAPPSCDESPAKCNQNLKNTIFGPVDKQTNSYAKDPFPGAFKDVDYEDDKDLNCDPTDRCRNNDNALIYKVYYPREHLYDPENDGCPLPAVILFHGGGFAECSSYEEGLMVEVAEQFAKRGFVAFVVEYRRGKIKSGGNFTSVQQQLAAWRACQDGRGAIRSIIKRQINHYTSPFINDPYQIDLNRIFIGGASAGGVIAMVSAWYTAQMAADAFPTPTGFTNIQSALGSIDIDYYYGDATLDYRSYIKGVLSMWGAIPIPMAYAQNQVSFFSQTTVVPVIAFHGKKDRLFNYPYNKQDVFFSAPPLSGTDYNKEIRCLLSSPYQLETDASSADVKRGSSLNIYDILKDAAIDKSVELYTDCDMEHGIGEAGTYFGTNLTSPDVPKYIVQRAATFFQAIMNNIDTSLGQDKFEDQENKRVKCNTNDNVGNQQTCQTEEE